MNANAQKNVAEPVIRNGVNVDALFATIDAVKRDPTIAEFCFRAENRWLGGDGNRTTVRAFHGANQEQPHAVPFTLDCGEPPVLLGRDQGANPVEHLLNALIGCLTTTLVYHAAARGIEIEAVNSELEGDLDLRGFLGISPDVRKGYQEVRVKMRVKSSASGTLLHDLAQFSPVFDVVSRALPVKLSVETY